MKIIDINCDMGEERGSDQEIIKYISSANIACGYHAGNREVMERTVELCLLHDVAIGAHPGYADKENFGRAPVNISNEEAADIVLEQIDILKEIAESKNAKVHHVKLHGSLYIKTYTSYEYSRDIFKKIKIQHPELIVYAAFNSLAEYACKELNMNFKREAFADRMYNEDGSIVPRKYEGAIIEDKELVVERAIEMVRNKRTITYNGNILNIDFDTLCIHGDTKNALEMASEINKKLTDENFEIRY